ARGVERHACRSATRQDGAARQSLTQQPAREPAYRAEIPERVGGGAAATLQLESTLLAELAGALVALLDARAEANLQTVLDFGGRQPLRSGMRKIDGGAGDVRLYADALGEHPANGEDRLGIVRPHALVSELQSGIAVAPRDRSHDVL